MFNKAEILILLFNLIERLSSFHSLIRQDYPDNMVNVAAQRQIWLFLRKEIIAYMDIFDNYFQDGGGMAIQSAPSDENKGEYENQI